MALTADQEAMLQLLLERGQSYADLASLLAISEPEVRARARETLAELGGEDPDRNVGLTDYLLGQADPIGRADAARHLREDVDDRRLAAALAERLSEVAPAAKLPTLPGERPERRRAPAAPQPASERRLPALSRGQTRLFVGIGSAAVLLIAVVLGVAGVFSGDDESDDPATTTTTTGGDGAQISENLARVPLRAVGGGDARGEATIGLASADTPYLDLTIDNLEPAPQGRSYFLWFMLGEDEGYPFVPLQLQSSGRFDDRFAIPSEYIPVVQGASAIDIWLSPNRELGQNIQDAIREVSFVRVPGDLVLHGPLQTQQSQSGQGGG